MDTHQLIVCRCEEVSLAELIETAEAYQCSARELKLRTRAGMGCCGGRTCRVLVDQVIEKVTGQTPSHTVPLGYQPPIRPLSFQLMGGRNK
ncbi:(2Fe-2S)-binding protein [Brevibacillus centrosporus]|uniref:BFD-like [2Fe-2S] binding domain-containing protein n=1 Tax=Brevibacillus centrosporus TaxID=54910 RepID=A0A1I4B8E6_9BACL|nr:(2Fe-2S)-binding protein [Brevibacillus centrosporus]MED4907904.1 (2Fe-2S)-binding protein [Brevibacillus centrosporus]SFK65118.1 BFD-like [2Fe-2S] binding domain-containing protein [Brevibacillus centrosporus]